MIIERLGIVEQLRPSEEQRPAITARGRDIAVVAGAGSGKTRTLVARYLRLIEEGIDLRHIVAITFTRKAAREMRSRARGEIARYLQNGSLDEHERDKWRSRYEQLDGARISTIHSFCAEILRTHPAEAGIDPRFEELPEGEQGRLLAQVVEDTLAWAATRDELVPLMQTFGASGLQDFLDQALKARLDVQRAFSDLPANPLAVWGERIMAWFRAGLSAPEASACLAELEAMQEDGSIARAMDQGDKLAPRVYELLAAWRCVNDALSGGNWTALFELVPALRSSMVLNVGSAKNWPGVFPRETIRGLQGWYDATFKKALAGIDPQIDQDLAQQLPLLHELFQYALESYTAYKDQRNALDFDDLESKALELLTSPDHPHVLARWQQEVQALLVDEFQDTNARQRDLITLLNGGATGEPSADGDGHNGHSAGKLFIVGDGKQSIYRFRGADVTVFRRERTAIRDRDGLCCELGTSYRAHGPLVQGLNDLLGCILNPQEDPGRLYAEPFAPLQPYRQEPAPGLAAPYIECHLTVGSKKERALDRAADALASRLIELIEKGNVRLQEDGAERALNYGDVAILCRSTRSFAPYEDALDRAGIPYITVAGRGFYERPEIRDLLNLLQAIADEGDDLALAGALRSPAFAVPDAVLYTLCSIQGEAADPKPTLWHVLADLENIAGAERLLRSLLPSNTDPATASPGPNPEPRTPDPASSLARAYRVLGELRARAGRVAVAALLKQLLDTTHYRAILIQAGQARAVRNVDKLLADAHTSGLVGVGEFLEYVQSLRDVSAREGEARALGEGAVQIMTIHAAKGLEFPIVILGDLAHRSNTRSGRLIIDPEFGPVPCLKGEQGGSFVYRLAKQREDDQEEEESRRLFYVAATRAQEKLILNANVTKTKKDDSLDAQGGWMGWLAGSGVLGLAGMPCPVNGEGVEPVQFERLINETSIACVFYPDQYEPMLRLQQAAAEPAATKGAMPLLAPVAPGEPIEVSEQSTQERENQPGPRVWRVVQEPGHYPAWLLGQVVHEALAQWRFPDATFVDWAKIVAQGYGLTDGQALQRIADHAQGLLNRLRRHPVYERLAQAQRRLHEVPFNMVWDEKPRNGRIDTLYQDKNGRWYIAEFKTDYVEDVGHVAEFLGGKDYVAQTRTYARAVAAWLGQEPIAELVLLNVGGKIHIERVTLAP